MQPDTKVFLLYIPEDIITFLLFIQYWYNKYTPRYERLWMKPLFKEGPQASVDMKAAPDSAKQHSFYGISPSFRPHPQRRGLLL